jgi:hypothetical protein
LRFATVAVIGPDWLLSSNKILPMLGTLAHALSRAASRLLATPKKRTRYQPHAFSPHI